MFGDDVRLVIIRGLPGTGKSTLAREIAEKCGFAHYETDQFFEINGFYLHQKKRIGDAIEWCYQKVKAELAEGKKVVITGTFTKRQSIAPYVDFGVPYLILECTKDYGSVHPVHSDGSYDKMKKAWETIPEAILL